MTQSSDLVAARLLELREELGPTARVDEPLARHTSIRIGGPADLFFVARSPADLVRAANAAHRLAVPWRIIGGGSNLLIADAGVEGLVIKATAPGAQVRFLHEGPGVLVEADAGAILAAVGKQAATRGYAGMEWAINVPGTVGASVVNNSGAFGSSVAEHLARATVFVPGVGTRTMAVGELEYAYRASALKRGVTTAVVLGACYRVVPGDREHLRARILKIQEIRRATQPQEYSLGSIFANPPGNAAGRLIEEAGLKGHRIGGAQVSELHANFIVNRENASANDVINLIRHIQDVIWQRQNLWLTPEIQLAGRHPESAARGLQRPMGGVA
jgi:UDP-N-acetylmuramate dehydrogenase